LPDGRPTLTHYRVDHDHSNAYTAWQAMGSPQSPAGAQYAALEQAGQLAELVPPSRVTVVGGRLTETFMLPRQGVSLIKIAW
jgi:xylan 1,4-beta-xylosidase